jgi:hypothetical protein
MFGLFKKNTGPECPIDTDMRLWMEQSFLWLATQFGHDNVREKTMLFPTPECFPVTYNGSRESLEATAAIVARQMEINMDEVNLEVFRHNIQEFNSGAGHSLFTEIDKEAEDQMAAGFYFEKNEQGKYDIWIEEKNLSDPEALVAVIAHEFSHIKILGEKRLDFNDELLTDLTTVVLGVGIFNSNAAFREIKTFDRWGHSGLGYLKQQEWGYALALYAYFREEEQPDWIKYLNPNIRSDFKKAQAYIFANTEKVFLERQ